MAKKPTRQPASKSPFHTGFEGVVYVLAVEKMGDQIPVGAYRSEGEANEVIKKLDEKYKPSASIMAFELGAMPGAEWRVKA